MQTCVIARILCRGPGEAGIPTFIRLRPCGLRRDYPHGTSDHGRHRYVIGAIHTNTIEGFWSIFKRGIVGSFHKVSKKYLPLYVAEFQFRYNNRFNDKIFDAAIEGC